MFALLDLLATSGRETLDVAGRAQPSLDGLQRTVGTLEARDPGAARRRAGRDITPQAEG